MPSGDGFSAAQRYDLDRSIRAAETVCRYEFSVYVGPADSEPYPFAQRLHASLAAPDRSVLIFVDPAARQLEIITGRAVRRDLDQQAVKLAAVAMQYAFTAGDLLGGIQQGLAMLAQAARQPDTLHTATP